MMKNYDSIVEEIVLVVQEKIKTKFLERSPSLEEIDLSVKKIFSPLSPQESFKSFYYGVPVMRYIVEMQPLVIKE